MNYAAANIWIGFGSAFVNPIVGWLVGIIISILIQKLDWLAFMLIENWEVTKEGEDYASAAENLRAIQSDPHSSEDAIKAAEEAKIAAFKRLVSLGSTPP